MMSPLPMRCSAREVGSASRLLGSPRDQLRLVVPARRSVVTIRHRGRSGPQGQFRRPASVRQLGFAATSFGFSGRIRGRSADGSDSSPACEQEHRRDVFVGDGLRHFHNRRRRSRRAAPHESSDPTHAERPERRSPSRAPSLDFDSGSIDVGTTLNDITPLRRRIQPTRAAAQHAFPRRAGTASPTSARWIAGERPAPVRTTCSAFSIPSVAGDAVQINLQTAGRRIGASDCGGRRGRHAGRPAYRAPLDNAVSQSFLAQTGTPVSTVPAVRREHFVRPQINVRRDGETAEASPPFRGARSRGAMPAAQFSLLTLPS